MTHDSLYAAKRRVEVLNVLQERGQASITELAAFFGVSRDTIRRDVDQLAEEGKVERLHGGAALLPAGMPVNTPIPISSRIRVNPLEKDQIAQLASTLIAEGESLLINGGTTTLALAKYLGRIRGITIVTNNLALPQELSAAGARDVSVLGGKYGERSQVTLGPVMLANGEGSLIPIHTDWAFIGVGAISEDGSVWTSDAAEANMMRKMMDCATQTVVLADSSKFDRKEFAKITDLSSDTLLITNQMPNATFMEMANERDIRIMCSTTSRTHN